MLAYNQFIYSRERRRFGRQCLFTDRTFLLLSIYPSQRLRLEFILRNPVTQGTQLSDQMAWSLMETENVVQTEHGMLHYEGGWPREVNIHDEEQTMRYRKKIEREDSWGGQVISLIKSAVGVCLQNTAVNIYQEFFVEFMESGHDICSSFEARQCCVFRDPVYPNRAIANVDFATTDIKRMLTVHTSTEPLTITFNEEDPQEAKSAYAIFCWNVKNPLKPLSIYDYTEFCCVARFCPKEDNYVAGGSLNGTVTIWDARTGGLPMQSCPLESNHRESVPALCWVYSKTNTEFYTGSYDGSIKFWDGRDLLTPLQEILLDPSMSDEQSRARAHGVSVLEFEYTIPVRFIIASDHGNIFIGNRKGTTPSDILLNNFKLFSGPIRTVERNPFFVKNFLITGDWCAKVWAEEIKSAPLTLIFKKKGQVLCGAWSTSRCSLFVTGDSRGNLDFWDLLLSHREPIFSIKYNYPVTYLKFRPDGSYLAIGLKNGETHIMEMDLAMKYCSSKDRSLIAALFEREQLRSKLLEGRVEEMKLRAKTIVWDAEASTEIKKIDLDKVNLDNPEEILVLIEADPQFKDALTNFKDIIYRVAKKRRERDYLIERTEFELRELREGFDNF